MAAALKVLLGDSSLPGMTHHRIWMVMVELAPGAALPMVMALLGGNHGFQHLPQPVICSLYCLHRALTDSSLTVKYLSQLDALCVGFNA